MKQTSFMRLRARGKSAGVAIVTAIFLLVVVAGLAVAVVSLSSSQQEASARDVQAQRAYQAAKAGVEWAAYRGLRTNFPEGQLPPPPQPSVALGCPAVAGTNNPPAPISFVPPAATLSGFTVTVRVTCDVDGGGVGDRSPNDQTAWHVSIESTACNQPVNGACPNNAPGQDYVQRVIRAQL
jgi:MSHA biogenesis protein MshP